MTTIAAIAFLWVLAFAIFLMPARMDGRWMVRKATPGTGVLGTVLNVVMCFMLAKLVVVIVGVVLVFGHFDVFPHFNDDPQHFGLFFVAVLLFLGGPLRNGFEAGFSPIRIFVLAAKAGGRAARSTFRVAPADVVKALLDCGEARFDHRLKFEVGEDIWQVLFDAFADEFTDIVGFYALRDAFPDHIDSLGKWARSRQGTEPPLEALGEIAS